MIIRRTIIKATTAGVFRQPITPLDLISSSNTQESQSDTSTSLHIGLVILSALVLVNQSVLSYSNSTSLTIAIYPANPPHTEHPTKRLRTLMSTSKKMFLSKRGAHEEITEWYETGGPTQWPTDTPETVQSGVTEISLPATWTCKICSQTMSDAKQAKHISSKNHIARSESFRPYHQSAEEALARIRSEAEAAQRGTRTGRFLINQRSFEDGVGRAYCDICRQGYRVSKRRLHQTPAWYCDVCDHYMHIISKDSHLGGIKHSEQLAIKSKAMDRSAGSEDSGYWGW